LACQARGHAIRAYVLSWEGDIPAGFEVAAGAGRALTNPAPLREIRCLGAQADLEATARPIA
jgi:hypothetical protein